MSENWTIDFEFTLPTGVKTRHGEDTPYTRTDIKNADKTYAVAKVINGEVVDGSGAYYKQTQATSDYAYHYEMVSFHDNQRLAEARASKENRECQDIDTEYFAVPLRIRNRGKCYFTNYNHLYGSFSSDEIAVVDTSAWGLHEWKRIALVWEKATLARHFEKGDHKFDGTGLSVYNKTTKRWEAPKEACSLHGCCLTPAILAARETASA